jgi:lysophospholipase L1-like esterase
MTLITEQALGSAEKRDSICFGQGVSPHLTGVVRLSAALNARYQHALDIIIQNPSVNGNTTRLALERMPYDIQSHTPHVLFVQCGMNDCNVWQTDKGHPRVSKAAFGAHYIGRRPATGSPTESSP